MVLHIDLLKLFLLFLILFAPCKSLVAGAYSKPIRDRKSVAVQYEPEDFLSEESPIDHKITPFVAGQLLIEHCKKGTLTRESRDELVQVYGADVNTCCGAPLQRAAEEGHEQIVDLLLELPEIDVTKLDSAALRYAAAKGHTSICQKLIAKGAKPHDWGGALFPAVEGGNVQTVEFLVRFSDPSTQNYLNRPLLAACQQGNLPIVRILLRNVDEENCNINVRQGKPLQLIVEQLKSVLDQSHVISEKITQYFDIIYLLLELGATPVHSIQELVILSAQCNEVLLLDYLLTFGSQSGNYPIDEKSIEKSIFIASSNNFDRALGLLQEYESFLKTCKKKWWGGFERL